MLLSQTFAEETEKELIEAGPPLSRELLLLEYQVSQDDGERAALYRDRNHFDRYWRAGNWLKLDFEQGEPCVRARHFVGLMPFRCAGTRHLIMVAPKGCSFDLPEKPLGLLRFLDLAAIASGGESVSDESDGWSGALSRETFVALLAKHYSRLLRDLCRKDFRRYFQPAEDELHSRVRGRIQIPAYVTNVLSGRAHRVPCRWEDFTPDNWDNRILLAAIRRLQQSAAWLAPEAGQYVRDLFSKVEPWFLEVKETPVGPAEFEKTRLWRISRPYQSALDWARLIIGGFGTPTGGDASALVINANYVFERFSQVVMQAAVARVQSGWQFSRTNFAFFDGEDRRPDLVIRDHQEIVAVGDAKYKDVLELGLSRIQLADVAGGIVQNISSADWNQLFIYIRLSGAAHGFFVVPFWSDQVGPAQLITQRDFKVSPLDRADTRPVRLAVLGLNLMHAAHRVRLYAAKLIADWLQDS